MGTYDSINGSVPYNASTTAAASRFYQRLFGTFVKDPANGLREEYNWPTYDPSRPTLMKLFRNNALSADLDDSTLYDEICRDPPPVPWAALAGPPPVC